LSELYDDAEKSKRAVAKAAELFKKQWQQNPRDGRLAMRLGQSLLGPEYDNDAEKLLRQAVELAPGDAECWDALGLFLWVKAYDALENSADKKTLLQMDALMAVFMRAIPPDHILKSSKIAKEACDCMDRAVTAAPRQARYYMARALARALYVALEDAGRAEKAEKSGLVDVLFRVNHQLVEAKVLADVQKAAELDPTNPRGQVLSAICEMAPHLRELLGKAKVKDDAVQEKAFKEFGVQLSRVADNLIAKLDALSSHQNKQIAADACCYEGMLLQSRPLLLTGISQQISKEVKTDAANLAKSERLLQRSVTLAPGNQLSWELLMLTLADQKKEKELLVLCEARLRAKDNARNRFLVANAMVRMNKYAEAEKHLRAGLAKDSDNTMNHVALAAVLLRSGNPARGEGTSRQGREITPGKQRQIFGRGCRCSACCPYRRNRRPQGCPADVVRGAGKQQESRCRREDAASSRRLAE
jgi:tetratricopeptide (TPR) repeat protein